jgi:hypothetical protein
VDHEDLRQRARAGRPPDGVRMTAFRRQAVPAVIFAVFLMGMTVGDRAFAYLHVDAGRFPFYVTELTIAALLVTGAFCRIRFPMRLPTAERIAWGIFALAALQSTVRGFLSQPAVNVLRDAAITYYAVFFGFGRWILADRDVLRRLAIALSLTMLLKILLSEYQLVAEPPFSSQPAAMGMYLSLFILSALAYSDLEDGLRIPLAIAAGLAGSLLFLYQVRTCWIGFAAGLATLLILMKPSLRRAHRAFAGIGAAVMVVGVVSWYFVDPARLAGSLGEVASLGRLARQPTAVVAEAVPAQPTDTPALSPAVKPLIETEASLGTSRTRLWMWGDMLHELHHDGTWAFGVSMGKPWLPPRLVPWWNLAERKRIDPHNSVLALFYRTGIFGVGAFLTFFALMLRRVFRFTRSAAPDFNRVTAAVGAAGAVYCLGHALTDVTFENPFKGLFVWLFLGLAAAWTRDAA